MHRTNQDNVTEPEEPRVHPREASADVTDVSCTFSGLRAEAGQAALHTLSVSSERHFSRKSSCPLVGISSTPTSGHPRELLNEMTRKYRVVPGGPRILLYYKSQYVFCLPFF